MKIESPARLKKTAEELQARPAPPVKLLVSMGTCGIAAGTASVLKAVKEEVTKRRLENAVEVVEVGCMGLCYAEPTLMQSSLALPKGEPSSAGNALHRTVYGSAPFIRSTNWNLTNC